MKTIWYRSSEGRQYWVQVNEQTMKMEMSSDCVSELVGGGYTIVLPDNIEDNIETLNELKNIFDNNDIIEIIALSRTLKKINTSDYINRNDRFYTIYFNEYLVVSEKY